MRRWASYGGVVRDAGLEVHAIRDDVWNQGNDDMFIGGKWIQAAVIAFACLWALPYIHRHGVLRQFHGNQKRASIS